MWPAANAQKDRALELQTELTDILTKAGGDERGTDHRVVQVQDALTGTAGVVGLFPPQINDSGDALLLSAIPERAPSSPATADLVRILRDDVLPEATSGEGAVTNVGGSTAANVDLAAKIGQRLPLVIATVVVLSFLLLMVAFHSLMVPLQAAVTNLLSMAAALGVLTAVFQRGWDLSLIGLEVPRGTVPIASFVINGDPTVKQFGVGLAVAVQIAGVMVVLFAPAMLVLFGGSVFRLPGFLDRLLPRIAVEGGVEQPVTAPATEEA